MSATVVAETWVARGLCYGSRTPDDWFLERPISQGNRRALAACRVCPVMNECHAHYENLEPRLRTSAIAGGQAYNVDGDPTDWGGTRSSPGGGELPPEVVDEVFSTGRAAAAARVSPSTIQVACQRGELPATRNELGHWRVRRADLEAWIRARIPDAEPGVA